jgi:hypothetical protein
MDFSDNLLPGARGMANDGLCSVGLWESEERAFDHYQQLL